MPDDSDRLVVQRVREGERGAWQEVIDRYEGRLLAFVESRIGNRAASEDVVQETFVGFLVSLPNYDDRTPLESWLFSIAAHKLTDHLRREGRRPTIPLVFGSEEGSSRREPPGRARPASTLARSRERRSVEGQVLGDALQALVDGWKADGEWERLQTVELLFVRGLPNKAVAEQLGISQQAVANHKHFVVGKLKEAAARARMPDFDARSLGLD